jgi:hypothetical protein
MGSSRARRSGQQTYTVCDDWFAWLPNEMDQLFDSTRNELECSNVILSLTLDEALCFCGQGEFERANERAAIFADLFDRLADKLRLLIRTIEEHGSHFGTLPVVAPLAPANFRGSTAQRLSMMNNLLAKVLFRTRTRFFHKLESLGEIIQELQREVRELVDESRDRSVAGKQQIWQQLEILGYDLNTCMGEATVVLKSFFCALPGEELESFRHKLLTQSPSAA